MSWKKQETALILFAALTAVLPAGRKARASNAMTADTADAPDNTMIAADR